MIVREPVRDKCCCVAKRPIQHARFVSDTLGSLHVDAAALSVEEDCAVDQRKQRVVVAHADVAAGMPFRAALADQNVSGNDVLTNIVIGEDNFRSVSGMLELKAIRTAIYSHFLITRGFRSICASVVAHNTRMAAALKLAGWEMVKRTMSRPSANDEMVELLLFRLTRENYIRRYGKSWVSARPPEPENGG